jgi:hypothetical protein
MSILTASGYGFGIAAFFKGLAAGEGGQRMAEGVVHGRAANETPVRRVRAAAATAVHVWEPERAEEDCERWDGLA